MSQVSPGIKHSTSKQNIYLQRARIKYGYQDI